MKRVAAMLLATACLLGLLSACGTPATPPAPSEPAKQTVSLDGKKVLFVGCSYTYYGGVVEKTDYLNSSLEQRVNDQGYFYQLCRANGEEVAVTDWCFGGHDLTDLFDGHCDANNTDKGHDHLADLTDRWYDYVVLQEIKVSGSWNAQDYLNNVKGIMELFRAANPDVKFLYVVHDGVYTGNYSQEWRKSVALIEQEGAAIVDWGTLVWDVADGTTAVPGSELSYNKSSFIVAQSESDGYHPNLLSGYLSALMTYCAITGKSAVGQSYAFCTDGTMTDRYFDLENFRSVYYWWDRKSTPVDESQTNFVEVFGSDIDMKGLQQLADQYLAKGSGALRMGA